MAEKEKKPIQVLRDRRGGMSDALKEYFKDQNQARKKLKDALKGGEKTVPQLSQETGLPSDKVLWHVMAMKRYGAVAERGHIGDYFTYGLKEETS